ncbi:protein of unknown function [Pseudomonas sp. JV241A]|nr:protein of unknown function [Pseudomonas sp. JV241A]
MAMGLRCSPFEYLELHHPSPFWLALSGVFSRVWFSPSCRILDGKFPLLLAFGKRCDGSASPSSQIAYVPSLLNWNDKGVPLGSLPWREGL